MQYDSSSTVWVVKLTMTILSGSSDGSDKIIQR